MEIAHNGLVGLDVWWSIDLETSAVGSLFFFCRDDRICWWELVFLCELEPDLGVLLDDVGISWAMKKRTEAEFFLELSYC